MKRPVTEKTIIAVDPGKDKCGLAIVEPDGTIVAHEIAATAELVKKIEPITAAFPAAVIVMGDGTTSKAAREKISAAFPTHTIEVIDEYRSTEEARSLYFADNPPQGWKRFLPRGLLSPPVPIDDYAAVVLARRFLRM